MVGVATQTMMGVFVVLDNVLSEVGGDKAHDLRLRVCVNLHHVDAVIELDVVGKDPGLLLHP